MAEGQGGGEIQGKVALTNGHAEPFVPAQAVAADAEESGIQPTSVLSHPKPDRGQVPQAPAKGGHSASAGSGVRPPRRILSGET